MEIIDQLVHTWSDVGLSGQTAGFRLRAASRGLRDPQSERYSWLEPYFPYNLPSGIPARSVSVTDAPVCLALINTGRERILVRKELMDADATGRPGAYITHLLAGLPKTFTARDAISLWHADEFWITAQNPLNPQQFTLPQFTIDELRGYARSAWKVPSLRDFQAALHIALAHFLRSSSPQRLCLSGSSDAIAALIWGVTQSLPSTLFPSMTFNTYEDDLSASQETIVGLFADRFLPADGLSFNVDTASRLPPARETDMVQQFITFAAKALCQRLYASQQDRDQLATLISLAEEYEIMTVDALLDLFQEQQKQASEVLIGEKKKKEQKAPETGSDESKRWEDLVKNQRTIEREKQPVSVPRRVDPEPAPPIFPGDGVPGPGQKGGYTVPGSLGQHSLAPTNVVSKVRAIFRQFWQELDRARSSRTLYRGTIFLLFLSTLLCAILILLLIALPISQNAARQSGMNSELLTQLANATATAQKTLIAEKNAQATFTAETNGVTFVAQKNWTVSVKSGTSFILSVEVQNTGTRTWSPQQNYQLKCIPLTDKKNPIDADCPPSREELAKVTTPVLQGKFYIFSFSFQSTGKSQHFLKVQMFQGQTAFKGTPFVLSFMIT